jgi:hypothetical protein
MQPSLVRHFWSANCTGKIDGNKQWSEFNEVETQYRTIVYEYYLRHFITPLYLLSRDFHLKMVDKAWSYGYSLSPFSEKTLRSNYTVITVLNNGSTFFLNQYYDPEWWFNKSLNN